MAIGDAYKVWGQAPVSDAEAREHEALLCAKRFVEIPSNLQMRADYLLRTDGQPTYLGFGPRSLASSDKGWIIQRFTYDVNGQCTLRQIAWDSWDNRDGATYA